VNEDDVARRESFSRLNLPEIFPRFHFPTRTLYCTRILVPQTYQPDQLQDSVEPTSHDCAKGG
jgi:hypothetical protein